MDNEPQDNQNIEEIFIQDLRENGIEYRPSQFVVDTSNSEDIQDPLLKHTVLTLAGWLETPTIIDQFSSYAQRAEYKNKKRTEWKNEYGDKTAQLLNELLNKNKLGGVYEMPGVANQFINYFPDTLDTPAVKDFVEYAQDMVWEKNLEVPENFVDMTPEEQEQYIVRMNDTGQRYDELSTQEKESISRIFEDKVTKLVTSFGVTVHKQA